MKELVTEGALEPLVALLRSTGADEGSKSTAAATLFTASRNPTNYAAIIAADEGSKSTAAATLFTASRNPTNYAAIIASCRRR